MRYKSCAKCKEESISKMQKDVLVILDDFTLHAPGEEMSLDFASLGKKKILNNKRQNEWLPRRKGD